MKTIIGAILMLVAAVYGSAGLVCAFIHMKFSSTSAMYVLYNGMSSIELLILCCGLLWFVHFIPGIAMITAAPDKRPENLEGELSFDTKRTV